MSAPVRAYGGWRERRGLGIGSLSGQQTAYGLTAVLLALLGVLLIPAALPLLAVALCSGLLFTAVRIRGESVAAMVARHWRWQFGRRTGATRYDALDTPELPGVLAGLEVVVVAGQAFIADGKRRTMSVVVPVEPQGIGFATAAEIEVWISGWGDWLAHLGYVPEVSHVQVTVHCAPQPFPVPDPPGDEGLIPDVMSELGRLSVARCETRTMLTITVAVQDSTESATLRLQEMVTTLDGLNRCGMTVLKPLRTGELTQWIRSCYDPQDWHSDLGGWQDARPTATREEWDAYRHDSVTSACFMWDECPGEGLSEQSLNRLLGPADYVKRVTLVYEPVPAHLAAREVDRQTQAALFRRQYRHRLGRDETARERLDMHRAQQTAEEQASGAGLVDVGMYVAVSAPDPSDLDAAAADLLNRAGEARIRMRRAYGSQAQCFAVTLGLGYVPARGAVP